MTSKEILEKIRLYCLQMPEVSERLSHGAPTFFVRKSKCFLMYNDNHHNVGWIAIWCAGSMEFQQAMIAQNPKAYFSPPYVGYRGWLGVRFDAGLEWEVIYNHLLEAYCAVAPQKLQAKLEPHVYATSSFS